MPECFYAKNVLMFTGLIEETGTIKSINKTSQGAVLTVECKKILDDLKIGDSVAINGACQTVVDLGSDYFAVEAALETLRLTNFNDLKSNSRVNLERAMLVGSRFGGHIVSGHIDGVGEFLNRKNEGMADIYSFKVPENISKYIVNKGSICVNGISLTVCSLSEGAFGVSVIPHTAKETTLEELKYGDKVNIECDIIAKYVEKFVKSVDNTSTNLTEDYLKENGFF